MSNLETIDQIKTDLYYIYRWVVACVRNSNVWPNLTFQSLNLSRVITLISLSVS